MLKIEKPFHGAILNRKHGKESEGGLKIRVCGTTHLLVETGISLPCKRSRPTISVCAS